MREQHARRIQQSNIEKERKQTEKNVKEKVKVIKALAKALQSTKLMN